MRKWTLTPFSSLTRKWTLTPFSSLTKLIIFVGAISVSYAGYAVVKFMKFQERHINPRSIAALWVFDIVDNVAKERGCRGGHIDSIDSCGLTPTIKICLSVKFGANKCSAFNAEELSNVLDNICYYAERHVQKGELPQARYALECDSGNAYYFRVDEQ